MTQSPPHLNQAIVAYGQPDHKYRAEEGISQSMMKEMLVSPAHFYARYGPGAEPSFPTAAMQFGLGVHCKTLEPDLFPQQFCLLSEQEKYTIPQMKTILDERGIEYKKTLKAAELEALVFPDGKPKDRRKGLKDDDFNAVKLCSEALRTHPIAGNWFSPGQVDYAKMNELSIYIRNELGQVLKGRIDRLQIEDGAATIVDLKTTENASAREFPKTCARFHYDLQAAWYYNLVQRASDSFGGINSVEFVFVVVERKPPFAVNVFKASSDFIRSGFRKMEETTDRYAQCKELAYWPAYDALMLPLEMPKWGELQEDGNPVI